MFRRLKITSNFTESERSSEGRRKLRDSYLHMNHVIRKKIHFAKTKAQISFAVTAKLISAFVFAARILQSLYFLASSLFLCLYSSVSWRTCSETTLLVSHDMDHIVYGLHTGIILSSSIKQELPILKSNSHEPNIHE